MKHIKAIQLNYYDHKSVQHNRANDLYYQYRIYSSDNGTDWTLAVDKSDNDKDVPHDYIELGETLDARYLKLENIHGSIRQLLPFGIPGVWFCRWRETSACTKLQGST